MRIAFRPTLSYATFVAIFLFALPPKALGGYAFTLSSSATDPLATVATPPTSPQFRQVYLWVHSYDPATSNEGLSSLACRLVPNGVLVFSVTPDSNVIAIGSDIQFGISACAAPYPRRLATIAIFDSAGTLGLAPLSGQPSITSADCDGDLRLPYAFGYSSNGTLPPHYGPPGTEWSTAFSNPQFGGLGLNRPAYALAVQNSSLYVGGLFTQAGSVSVNALASYTEAGGWSDVGGGVTKAAGDSGDVRALLASGSTDLDVGGKFERAGSITANCVARRVGATSWAAYEPGFNSTVFALARYQIAGAGDARLVAGGDFARRVSDGSSTLQKVAWWNGTGWHRLIDDSTGVYGTSDDVLALVPWAGKLVVGGMFTSAGGRSALRIATWEVNASGDSVWSPLGSGFNDPVYGLAAFEGNLYATGPFEKTGDNLTTLNGIARWDASAAAWLPVGGGFNGGAEGQTLQPLSRTSDPVDDDYLLVGGTFASVRQTSPSDPLLTPALNIARWRTSTPSQQSFWTTLGRGVVQAALESGKGNYVQAIASFANHIYLAGNFKFVDSPGLESYAIAAWLPDVDAVFVPEHSQRRGPDASGIHLGSPNPNPTKYSSTCLVELAVTQVVALAVFDVAGRRVRQLFEGRWDAGIHSVTWDGRDSEGVRVASGTYFIRLSSTSAPGAQRVTILP